MTVKDINGKYIGEIIVDIPYQIPVEGSLLYNEETSDSTDNLLFYKGVHEIAKLNTLGALECFRQLRNCSDKDIRKSSKHNFHMVKRLEALTKCDNHSDPTNSFSHFRDAIITRFWNKWTVD